MTGCSRPLVYAIVLNYNGLEFNRRCLDSLLAQDYSNLQVLFVDNASEDGSLKDVRRRYAGRIQVLANSQNFFFAEGNNRGIQRALENGPQYVFIVNNDTVLEESCVSGLVSFMESQPEAGGCQPLMLHMPKNGVVDETFWESGTIASAGIHISLSGRCWDALMGQAIGEVGDSPVEVNGITGGAMFLRATVAEATAGFDPSYVMYYEDADLSLRIRKFGHSLHLVPSSRVGHVVGGTTANHASLLRLRLCETNSYRLIAAHFPVRYLVPAFASSLFFSLGSSVKAVLKGRCAVGGAVLRGAVLGVGVFFKSCVMGRRLNNMLAPYIRSDTLFPPAF